MHDDKGRENDAYPEMFEKYGKQDQGIDPLDDARRITKKTSDERRRAFKSFQIFCQKINRSCDDIFIGLCLEDRDANNNCRMFLRWYINEHRKQKVLSLGPEEYKWKRAVNTVTTVLNLWVRILAQVDATILATRRKMEQDGSQRLKWRLIQPSCKGNVASKTYPIKTFICNEFAKEFALSKRRWQFDKKELTGSDVIVLLETWYTRANVLLYTPQTTQTFHFLMLIEAITGCRPGCLGDMRWGDFTI